MYSFQLFDLSSQFLYGCMYLMFEAFPIVYIQGHHFGTGEFKPFSSQVKMINPLKVRRASYGYR